MQHLTFICHGFRADWENADKHPRTGAARFDPPLAAIGVEQGRRTATKVVLDGPAVTAIWSSPFLRCLQTADPFGELAKVPVQIHWSLGEIIPEDMLPRGWDSAKCLNTITQKRLVGAIGLVPYPETEL